VTVLIDAHAHLHDARLGPAFDAASRSFTLAARRLALEVDCGVLLLAEPPGTSRFEGLLDEDASPWTLERTVDPEAVRARRTGHPPVFVIAGCQLVTREKLEVHALMTNDRFRDGEALDTTLNAVCATAALGALPWGVGKWWGRRGRLIRAALKGHPDVVPTDNGGRPWFWPLDRSIASARSMGRVVLAGSDPLPLSDDWRRLGSCGVACEAPIDVDLPVAAIRAALTSEPRPRPYGSARSFVGFFHDQTLMQLRGGS